MTDDKGAGEPFAKAITKGVLIAQDLEPGMTILVGGYVFTGKYTTWADQINREFDERVKAERERCLEIVGRHPGKCDETTPFDCLQEIKYEIGGKDAK